MATQNSINKKTGNLTLDPGAAGDSALQFDINATGEFRIGVDDTDDSFRISQGSALGTNDTFVMSDAGERRMPLQPASLAYLFGGDNAVTGAGTTATLGSATNLTEIYDQNSNFNVNGTFTAPTTGVYLLAATMRTSSTPSLTSLMTHGLLSIVTTNRDYQFYTNTWNHYGVGSGTSYEVIVIADMTAADTAIVQITVSNGAADTLNISGGAAVYTLSNFSGTLLA